jgi:hypothetical protein
MFEGSPRLGKARLEGSDKAKLSPKISVAGSRDQGTTENSFSLNETPLPSQGTSFLYSPLDREGRSSSDLSSRRSNLFGQERGVSAVRSTASNEFNLPLGR